MLRLLKILAWSVAGLMMVFATVLVGVSLFVDPNDYKQDIARAVQDRTGRQFEIQGDLEVSVFPWLGVEAGGVALSNPAGFDDDPMLSIDQAAARLRLLPLLRRNIEADEIVITRPRLSLLRDAHGQSNWDDLAGLKTAAREPSDNGPENSEPGDRLSIMGITIEDAKIMWDDRRSNVRYEVDGMNLTTGPIVSGSSTPLSLDLQIEGNGIPGSASISANTDIELAVGGDTTRLSGLKVRTSAAVPLSLEADGVEVRTTDGTVDFKSVAVRTELAGTAVALDVPEIRADFRAGEARMQNITASVSRPEGNADLRLGSVDLNIDERTWVFRDLGADGRFAEIAAELRLPELTGDIDGGRVAAKGIEMMASYDDMEATISAGSAEANLNTQKLDVPDFTANVAGVAVTGRLEGQRLFDSPSVEGSLHSVSDDLRETLRSLNISFAPADDTVLRTARLSGNFAATRESISISQLAGSLDDVSVAGTIGVSGTETPDVRITLDIGEVMVDRYLPQTSHAPDTDAGLPTLPVVPRVEAAFGFERLVLEEAGYDLTSVSVKADSLDEAGTIDLQLTAHAEGEAVPEAVDVSARARVNVGTEQITVNDIEAGAKGENVQLRFAAPSIRVDLGTGQAAAHAPSAQVDIGPVQARVGFSQVEFAAPQQQLTGTGLAGEIELDDWDAGLSVSRLEGELEGRRFAMRELAITLPPDGSMGRLDAQGATVDLSAETLRTEPLVFQGSAGRVEMTLEGERIMSTPAFHGGIETEDLDLRALLELKGAAPDMADPEALRHVAVKTRFDVAPRASRLDALSAVIDDTRIGGFIEITHEGEVPSYLFDLNVGELDLDRYLPQARKPDHGAPASGTKTTALPVEWVRKLEASGEIALERIKALGVEATDVAVSVRVDDANLRADPVRARMYGGRVEGAFALDAGNDPPALAVTKSLIDMDVGAALSALGISDALAGTGDIDVALSGRGENLDALVGTLGGKASATVRDGAIRGVDLRRIIGQARTLYEEARGREGTVPALPDDETRFSSMSGTADFLDGVAHNDDLIVMSPYLRAQGRGTASVPDDRIDYLLDVTLVDTPEGQGGRELTDLEGVPIPIRMSGALSDPRYQVDIARIVELRLQEEIERERNKQLERLEDKLRDKLKGLLD